MTHQNLRLGKCWKLFWATLKYHQKGLGLELGLELGLSRLC